MNLVRTFLCRSLRTTFIRQSQIQSSSENVPEWVQPKNEPVEIKRRRLLYQSRKRGMLENDLLLSHFAALYLPTMNSVDLDLYDKLINTPSNDWDLYYMATGKIETSKEYQHHIMDLLKQFIKNKQKENRTRQPDVVPV